MELTADNPAPVGADNPSVEPAAVDNGTGTADGQVSGGTPESQDQDIFKGIDPKTLTPKERQLYNSMLTDYRTKTGKLSETVKSQVEKEVAAYREKASQYEMIANEEAFVKQWNDYVKKTQEQTGESPKQGDPVLTELQEKFKSMEQKLQQAELSKVTDAFAEAVDDKGVKLRPDFDALNNKIIGKVGNEEYSLLRASIEMASGRTPQEKLANGYKAAKAFHDAIFEEGRKAGLGRLQEKSRNGTIPPSNSGGEVLTTTEKRPKNAHEALQMARRGIKVSAD